MNITDINAFLPLINMLVVVFGVVLGLKNIKKYTHSRKIDTIVNFEGQVDALMNSLMSQSAATVRAVWTAIPPHFNDDQVKAYAYYYEYYCLVARIFYLLDDKDLEVGMSKADREEQIDNWLNSLKNNRENPVLLAVHREAITARDFSPRFLLKTEEILGTLDQIRKTPSTTDK